MQQPGGAPSPLARAELVAEPGAVSLFFGILLPVITFSLELGLRLCAGEFFDPFPTAGHIFAVAMVPLANGLAWRALWRREAARLDAIIFAQALAVTVAGVYTLTFLPLLPMAIVATIVVVGLLPLTPLLAFWASIISLRRLCRLRDALQLRPRRTVLAGLAAGVGVMVALQVPTAATRVLVAMAASDSPSVRSTGLAGLRRFGERDLLLRACYQKASGSTDLLSAVVNAVAPVPPDQVREIYYRVTGRPFDTEPRPRLGRSQAREGNEWDVIQGGTEVGVVPLRGLSLTSSRLDGSIDARAALAYLEWTFELRNEAPLQREARAEVALPPGSVVSRVTLWVDGLEREAVFGGREATRRAYVQVVRARRDPILVTTTAPDRILVQCFPVPPNGGVMKARIGITAPLHLARLDAGTLALPYLTQRNFDVPGGHAVWIAGKAAFRPPAAPLVREVLATGEEIRGTLAEPPRPGPIAAITVQRPADQTISWSADRLGRSSALIRQTLREEAIPRPARLLVVVDGSQAMRGAATDVAAGLRALPGGLEAELILAGDPPRELSAAAPSEIDEIDFAGGADSVPALVAAWDRAASRPGTVVLWIHGPQAMLLGPVEELRQRLERRRDGPRVYTYAAAGGENRVLTSLADFPAVKPVPRLAPGPGDLTAFLGGLGGAQPRIGAVRERLVRAAPPEGAPTSDHLARLWAHDSVLALAQEGPEQRRTALALASQYHLVTPVSGAVVLETDQQYRDAGLEPGDGSQVPTVPEPETWALLALVAAVLIFAVSRRRRFPVMGHAA